MIFFEYRVSTVPTLVPSTYLEQRYVRAAEEEHARGRRRGRRGEERRAHLEQPLP